MENWRSANKGKSEKGEAWLENIEIHPDFFPAEKTVCSMGPQDSRGVRKQAVPSGWKPLGRHFVSSVKPSAPTFPRPVHLELQSLSGPGREEDHSSRIRQPWVWNPFVAS